jgi:hypothetical protein
MNCVYTFSTFGLYIILPPLPCIRQSAVQHIFYVGESNEHLKYFYLVIYWTQKYTMTSFFYLIFTAYHTSVPALRKCTDTSRKTLFWLRAQPLMHRLLSSDLKDLHPIASLSGPKTWKSLGTRSGEYRGCGKLSKDRSWIVATIERAVWGRALSWCNKTPVM